MGGAGEGEAVEVSESDQRWMIAASLFLTVLGLASIALTLWIGRPVWDAAAVAFAGALVVVWATPVSDR